MKQVLTTYLLSLRDKEQWSVYLNRLPESMLDVYFTPHYYEICEKNGDGKAFCFVFEDGDHFAMYPFLLNRINDLNYELNDDYYDIQGAYGYNGVVYSSNDPDFIRTFYIEFNQFCKDRNIIAEFTRFHPLLENHKFSEDYLNVIYNRQSVYVDLTKDYDEIYKSYSRKLRKELKIAKENDLLVLIFENDPMFKKEFIEMYKETMDKVNAERYLYFNHEYFNNLFLNVPITQFVVFSGSEPIASSLCIYDNYYFHGHLGCSKAAFLSLYPNSLIYDAKIRYAIEKKFKIYNLGGGRSIDENDSLLSFKKKFSKTINNFYIGKKVHNREVLQKIYEQWETKYSHLVDKYKNTFLKYRNFTMILIFPFLQQC